MKEVNFIFIFQKKLNYQKLTSLYKVILKQLTKH